MPTRVIATRGGQQIVIELDGPKSTVTTRGFVGSECQLATAAVEAALGTKTADQPTAEMYQPQRAGHGLKQ